MTRWLTVCALIAALSTVAAADDPKLPDARTFDKLVVDSLRDVHNKGADLYNTAKDFPGAYRMYEGALLTVRPLLGHRPEAQKLIADGVAAAEKESDVARRAFMLHETIEKVRAHLKTTAAAEPKKPDELKKPDDKKPQESVAAAPGPKGKGPGDAAKPAGGPALTGQVTLKGQPLPGGDVIFVSLDQPKPRVFTAAIQPDGNYAVTQAVPEGQYVVTVTGKGVPEKYQTTTTSGLRAEVKPPMTFDIALQ
jgi:hypothetical protein